MADILEKICADKRIHVAACKARRSLADLEAAAQVTSDPLGFANALEAGAAAGGWGLIAEIKRASPSAGEIRPDFDPASLARAYRAGGASCLSVLTDEPYFKGQDSYVLEAKTASKLPCLRKDFMIDPYQVVEARAIGADCILIIMAAVDDGLAAELADTAAAWKLDVLVEVHNGEELDRALRFESRLLGINNRNLKTLAVDLATTEALAPRVPEGRVVVCESGIKRHEDLTRMAASDVRCFLVGEHLMRQQDVTAATKELLGYRPGAAAAT